VLSPVRSHTVLGRRPEEVSLAGGATSGDVVRVGDTVRRPSRPSSPLMREVLQRLERAGFDGAPRWLGVDEQGRDVLGWIEGDTFTDRTRLHPYVGDPRDRVTFSSEQVAAAMRLLRRYHDACADEVVCHGDFGPWNLVWRDGLPVALIDFDAFHSGDASEDVAYALRTFIGHGLVPEPAPELVRRTQVALDAYGRAFDVPAILAREYDLAEERCRRNGWTRQLARLPLERAWLEAHRGPALGRRDPDHDR
jgi:Phosphotransferase enzyme family